MGGFFGSLDFEWEAACVWKSEAVARCSQGGVYRGEREAAEKQGDRGEEKAGEG